MFLFKSHAACLVKHMHIEHVHTKQWNCHSQSIQPKSEICPGLVYIYLVIDVFTIISLIAIWKEYQRKLGKLGEKLNEFYHNKVVIDKASMQFATNILNSVNQALEKYLDINQKYYPVREFILQGSVAEGLTVCKPNEFDVSIPVILPDDLFEAVKDSPGIGTFRYKNEEDYSNLWTYFDVHEKHGYDKIETHN